MAEVDQEFGKLWSLNIEKSSMCIWNQTGAPLAVHPLKDVKKIVAATVEVDEVKITGIDKQEKQYKFIFDLNKSNQTKILTVK